MVLNEKIKSGDSSLSGDQAGAQADSGPRSELKPELREPELSLLSDCVASLPEASQAWWSRLLWLVTDLTDTYIRA